MVLESFGILSEKSLADVVVLYIFLLLTLRKTDVCKLAPLDTGELSSLSSSLSTKPPRSFRLKSDVWLTLAFGSALRRVAVGPTFAASQTTEKAAIVKMKVIVRWVECIMDCCRSLQNMVEDCSSRPLLFGPPPNMILFLFRIPIFPPFTCPHLGPSKRLKTLQIVPTERSQPPKRAHPHRLAASRWSDKDRSHRETAKGRGQGQSTAAVGLGRC
mmetsp:Transcript_62054/g.166513  ORF Transcript_62054/g.166513 Transcript_62054/m.166513 type:complete len:215 (+) Transcript_62054:75-719(+)